MYQYYFIPVIIFIIFLVPLFFLGWKKGWRFALFFALVTFTLSGITIGICIGIYDSTIWPSFKNHLLVKNTNSSLDIDHLKDLSRPSALSLVMGILSLPILLLSYLLYLPFKKWLTAYMNTTSHVVEGNNISVQRKK